MCCSQIWSPDSQLKWYQLLHWNAISVWSAVLFLYQMPLPFQ